jgi:hypothetical protein
MPTIPDPLLRQDYAGLNSAESDLLRGYLRDLESPVDTLKTQLKVAPGELPPESRPDALRRQWRESSKFKIDALVMTDSEVQIIELKDLARTSALGQLLCYRYWYELEREPSQPVSLHCVATEVNPGAVQPYRFNGAEIHPQTADGRRHYQQGLNAQPPFTGLEPNTR